MGDILTLRDLLTENSYQIPTYKRKYCWDDEQCSALWHSISEIVRNNARSTNQYMGTLICLDNDVDHNIELIDGQQRLVTLSLFLGIMRNKLLTGDVWKDTLKQYLFNDDGNRIRLSSKTDNRFYTQLLLDDAVSEGRSLSSLILWKVYEKYYGRIDVMNTDMILNFCDAMLDRLYFTVYKVCDSYEARKAIESINEKGKKPSDFELLRCHLLNWIDSNITDINEKESLERKITEIWDKAEEYVFCGKLKKDDLDAFLEYCCDVEKETAIQNYIRKYGEKPHRTEYKRPWGGYWEIKLRTHDVIGSDDAKKVFLAVLNNLKTRLDSFCVEVEKPHNENRWLR